MPASVLASQSGALPRVVHLPAEPDAAAAARRFVAECFAYWELADGLPEAALVADELVTNAVRHARSDVTLCVAHRPGRLVLQVEDSSSDLPVPAAATVPLDVAGRGLKVIDSLSSRWGVAPLPEGKRVWAELEV